MQNTISKEVYAERKKQTQIKSGNAKTSQDKKLACDINRIMARAKKNGILPDLNNRQVIYADFTVLPNYQEALNKVIKMETEFMQLPALTRKEFDNDPQKLVEFLSDPTNEERAISLGLVAKPIIQTKKIQTPEGDFWVTTKNNKEIAREAVAKKTTEKE